MHRSSARALVVVSALAALLLAVAPAWAVVDAVTVDEETLALAAGLLGLVLFPRLSRGRARDGER